MKAPECTSQPIMPLPSSASLPDDAYIPMVDTVTEIFQDMEEQLGATRLTDSPSLRNDYAWDPMEQLPSVSVWTGRETIDLTTVRREPCAETDGMTEPSSSSEQTWTGREHVEIRPTSLRTFIPLPDDDATHRR